MTPVNNNAHATPVINNHHITPPHSHQRLIAPSQEPMTHRQLGAGESRNIQSNRSTDCREYHTDVNGFSRNMRSVTNCGSNFAEYRRPVFITMPEHESMIPSSHYGENARMEYDLNENIEEVLAQGARLVFMANDVRESLEDRETFKPLLSTKCRMATSLCSVIGLGLGFMGGYCAYRQFNNVPNQDPILNTLSSSLQPFAPPLPQPQPLRSVDERFNNLGSEPLRRDQFMKEEAEILRQLSIYGLPDRLPNSLRTLSAETTTTQDNRNSAD